jgi:hypothetical protein
VYLYTWSTWWGSASIYSQSNQTLGQQDCDDPGWIDNSRLLIDSAWAILVDEVATHTLGRGDNTLVQWFSDPDSSVQALSSGVITHAGDKLAFVANVDGGLGNEIRIYRTMGPPLDVARDPSDVAVDRCNIGPYFGPARVGAAPPRHPVCGHRPVCKVPRLGDLSLAAARVRLRRADRLLGGARTPRHARHRLVVVSRHPSPGGSRPANSRVNVVLGPPARQSRDRGAMR